MKAASLEWTSLSGYAGGRPWAGAGKTRLVCPNPKRKARKSAATAIRATAHTRHFLLLDRDTRELALSNLQEVHAGRELEVRIRDPRALDAHAALGDQPARFRARCRQAQLRQGLRQRHRLDARIARDLPLFHFLRDLA